MYLGEEIHIFDWFRLHYIENNGMAYGLEFGGEYGKLFLTLFRICVVIWGMFYVYKLTKSTKFPSGLLILLRVNYRWARLGNIVDSVFFGDVIFYGKVVDMLYFPLTGESYFLPDWLPFFGGDHFIFFRPIFNIADSGIFLGIVSLIFFYRSYFK